MSCKDFLTCKLHLLSYKMMACSYVSANNFKPESAGCWTPPSMDQPGPHHGFRPVPEESTEPALDLTTFKPKPSDEESE
ncbi:unnamed protein product [Leptosia nina]|uniref:Uncharacterized protein n=1 Tax=Leptosia nina TaxID=320188 RepID=A0AAV1JLF7_9NEOP